MRTPSDSLYQLIQSMSRGEKLNFRQFARSTLKKTKANYQLLYEEMLGSSNYNEARIKAKLSGRISQKNFAYEKGNLLNIICRSMALNESRHTQENHVFELTRVAKIFYKKELYDLALRKLKKADKEAAGYDLFGLQLQIYVSLRKVLIQVQPRDLKNQLKEIAKLETFVFDQYKQYLELNILANKIYQARMKDDGRSLRSSETGNALFNNSLLQDRSKIKSMVGTFEYYRCLNSITLMKGEYKLMVNYLNQLVEILEEHPKYIVEYPMQYIAILLNLLTAKSNTEDYDQTISGFDKLKLALEHKQYAFTEHYKCRMISIGFGAISNSIITSGSFEKVRDFSILVEYDYAKYKYAFDRLYRIQLFHNIAYAFFVINDLKKSLYWINKVVNDRDLDEYRGDFHSATRILNVMIHFDLGNFELVQYNLESFIRFLQKKDSYGAIEEVFKDYMSRLHLAFGDDEMIRELYGLFKQALWSLDEKGAVQGIFAEETFPFLINWIESKLNGIPILEQIRTKNII